MKRQVRVSRIPSEDDASFLKLTSSFARETYNNSQDEHHLPAGNWIPIDFKNVDSGISSADGLNSQESGYQAHAWANVDTKQIILANAGTKSMQDVGNWPSVVTGNVSDQVKSAIDAIQKVKAFTEGENGADIPYPDYQIITTGHSLGGFFSQVQAAVFGLKGSSFDAPGGNKLINDENFQEYLKQAGIESKNKAVDFIDVKLGGFGPIGGGVVGSGASNVDGVKKTYYLYGTKNIILGLMNVAAFVLGNVPGVLLGKLASGVLAHGISGIDETIQQGNFVLPTKPPSEWDVPVSNPPLEPFSFKEDNGNYVSTVQSDYGIVVQDGQGQPVIHVEVKGDKGDVCNITISPEKISNIVTDSTGHTSEVESKDMSDAVRRYMESSAYTGISEFLPSSMNMPSLSQPVFASLEKPIAPALTQETLPVSEESDEFDVPGQPEDTQELDTSVQSHTSSEFEESDEFDIPGQPDDTHELDTSGKPEAPVEPSKVMPTFVFRPPHPQSIHQPLFLPVKPSDIVVPAQISATPIMSAPPQVSSPSQMGKPPFISPPSSGLLPQISQLPAISLPLPSVKPAQATTPPFVSPQLSLGVLGQVSQLPSIHFPTPVIPPPQVSLPPTIHLPVITVSPNQIYTPAMPSFTSIHRSANCKQASSMTHLTSQAVDSNIADVMPDNTDDELMYACMNDQTLNEGLLQYHLHASEAGNMNMLPPGESRQHAMSVFTVAEAIRAESANYPKNKFTA